MIPIAKPLLGSEEREAIIEVLNSGMLAQGKVVEEFENSFAAFLGVKHAIATSNGTTALHSALLAHNIGPGDEVITTPFTFIATANMIRACGAEPVFVDIEEETFNMNPELLEAAITEKTKAIMPVHLYGKCANMTKIQEIADKHNLIIIEDACQAHGSLHNEKKAGTFGTATFSFYPTKNMTTGEGGMITTNDDQVADKCRKLIAHHAYKQYHHNDLGFNFRMTNIAAAIGKEQLKKLGKFTEKRKLNAAILNAGLSNIRGLITPKSDPEHVYHQYTLRLTPEAKLSRNTLQLALKDEGISAGIYYPVPIHKQEAYKEQNHLSFPISEKLAQEVLSLPVHPNVSEDDLRHITKTVRGLLE